MSTVRVWRGGSPVSPLVALMAKTLLEEQRAPLAVMEPAGSEQCADSVIPVQDDDDGPVEVDDIGIGRASWMMKQKHKW